MEFKLLRNLKSTVFFMKASSMKLNEKKIERLLKYDFNQDLRKKI